MSKSVPVVAEPARIAALMVVAVGVLQKSGSDDLTSGLVDVGAATYPLDAAVVENLYHLVPFTVMTFVQ